MTRPIVDIDNDLIVLSDEDGCLSAASPADVHHPLAAGLGGPGGERCVTCSDEGRPGRVVAPPAEPFGPALVATDTGQEEVDTTLVGDVAAGDELLIHAGMALAKLSAVR
jgi:hypothetical protein